MKKNHTVRTLFTLLIVSAFFGLTVFVVYGESFPVNQTPWLLYKNQFDSATDLTNQAAQYRTKTSDYGAATFDNWKTVYGFDNPTGTARAVYYNGADLGLTRDMNCHNNIQVGGSGNIACYVSNHGLAAAGPQLAGLSDGINDVNTIATVAMVWDSSKVVDDTAVQFYVFDDEGEPITFLALDSEGPKAVPHLCLACHGGSYDATENLVKGANFLPWDPFSFEYADADGWRLEDQQEEFRQMNDMVMQTSAQSAIKEFITGSYTQPGGVSQPGNIMNDNYIPNEWNQSGEDFQLYNEVIKHDCRICHVAQPDYIDLLEPTDLSVSAVLERFIMPHAELTFKNFWRSTRPATLARLTNAPGDLTLIVTRLDDPIPGGCFVNDCSLREAVISANSKIATPASTEPVYITFAVDGTFEMEQSGRNENAAATGDYNLTNTSRPIFILGNGYEETVISGEDLDRIFDIGTNVEARIQHLSLSKGNFAFGGGAIRNNGDLQLHDLAIYDNQSILGGGILNNSTGELEIARSTIRNNATNNKGGGVLNLNGTVQIEQSTLTENTASQGAGLFSSGGSVTTSYATIAKNIGTDGAGIYTEASAIVNLISTLIGDNVTPGGAGNDCEGSLKNVENSLLESTTCTIITPYRNLLGVDPLLEPLTFLEGSTGVLPLATNSPAIDYIKFDFGGCIPSDRDQRNVVRPARVLCDIGAVEKIECDRDAFGYELCPIIYEFEDISATGTALTLGDDDFASVTMPFMMPFYNAFYDEIFVGSNGTVTFGAGSTSAGRERLPAASAPDNMIAALWIDLDPSVGGSIQTQQVGDRFIVQFTDVDLAFLLSDIYVATFQIQLFPNGDIELHHRSAADFDLAITIGLQNANGESGATYYDNGLDAYTGSSPRGMRISYPQNQIPTAVTLQDYAMHSGASTFMLPVALLLSIVTAYFYLPKRSRETI